MSGIGLGTAARSVLVVATLLAAGCGVTAPADTAIADEIRSRIEAADGSWGPAQDYRELLPTTFYRDVSTRESFNTTTLFVIGDVVSAAPGRYFSSQDEDPSQPESTEVDAKSTDASWATIHVTLKPSLVVDANGPSQATSEITFGLSVGPRNVERFAEELSDFGTVAVTLFEGSALFTYDPSIYGITYEGALLAIVDESRALQFPFADDHAKRELGLTSGLTVDAIESSAQSRNTVDVVMVGPVAIRRNDTEALIKRGIDPDNLPPAG